MSKEELELVKLVNRVVIDDVPYEVGHELSVTKSGKDGLISIGAVISDEVVKAPIKTRKSKAQEEVKLETPVVAVVELNKTVDVTTITPTVESNLGDVIPENKVETEVKDN